MREIKFRGIYNDVFVYGNLIQGVYDGRSFTQIENTDNNDFQKWEVNPKTVGEFTGLKDKNGVDIYEGDIVIDGRDGNTSTDKFHKAYAIVFDNVRAVFEGVRQEERPFYFSAQNLYWSIIIGNIYQNKELLIDKQNRAENK